MMSKSVAFVPALAAGAAVVAGVAFLYGKGKAKQEEADVFSTLDGIISPEVSQGAGCCGGMESSNAGCCNNSARQEEASSCGCSSASERIRVGQAADGRVGLPKEEYQRLKKAGLLPKQIAKREVQRKQQAAKLQNANPDRCMVVLFASQGGKSESIALDMREDACEKGFSTTMESLQTFDMALFLAKEKPLPVAVFVVSSWTGGTAPPAARPFFEWINSAERPAGLLTGLKYCLFGLGDSAYGKEDFCGAARALDKRLEELGASRQCESAEEDESDRKEVFGKWKDLVWMSQGARVLGNSVQFIEGGGDEDPDSSSASEGDDDESAEEREEEEGEEEGQEGGDKGSGLTDLEDLGNVVAKMKKKGGTAGKVGIAAAPKPMLNDTLAASLTKQGYKLVGTHSGVKLCRWTKAMLRGRGGCYKHTFYGIASYQCMEATPSLACANKCVFCWRHHKNPVGTHWRWQVDDPELLIKGFMHNHRAMIREMRGLPGVIPSRLQEAQTIRHCALSLVGEPIIYPHINTFLNRLHEEGISSFLVSNAQFPAQMEDLVPCTQLYVSIDASNAAELKEIDRPLFKDFWQRFLDCIDILANKGQRTVFRLTLVKSFNMSEVEGYAELIRRGKPDFVEIKGVTFTGGNKPQLGMTNVPWHQEVVDFSSAVCSLVSDEYEIASEHAHSCAVLIAHKKFKKGTDWYTWIDFPKFLQLAEAGKPFNSMDYMARTPEWAVFGRGLPGDGGFDPNEVHWRKGDSRTSSLASTPASTRPGTPSSFA